MCWRAGRETRGPAAVCGTPVLNEISNQGTTAIPNGFGRIAGDFAAGSPIGAVLDKKVNYSREGNSCALAYFKR